MQNSISPAGGDEAELRARAQELEQQLEAAQSDAAVAGLLERRYRTLADSMPQMVWATDSDGSHFYFNRRWYEYTGLSEASSLGFGFTNALHPDDLERTLERWQRAWRDGESYDIEYRFRRHDGVYHWFIGRANPVFGRNGSIIEWVGTCTDIDDQKRATETQRFLAEAGAILTGSLNYEETLSSVAQLAVPQIADWCAIDILDDGKLRRLAVAHPDAEKIALAEELQRRTPFDPQAPTGIALLLRTGQPQLIPQITEAMIEAAQLKPEIRAIVDRIGMRSMMLVPLAARGRVFGAITLVASESGRVFTEDDLDTAQELAQRASAAVDSARLYSELHQFKTTLDQTLDSVFMYDSATLRFFYANQGALDHIGYTPAELYERTTVDIKPTFTEEAFRAMIVPLLDGSQPSLTFETIHRHKDGHDIPVENHIQYVATEGGGRIVSVVRDISERRAAEKALRASAERYRALAIALEDRNRELDQFAYVTSHDLKAPLRGIANLSQWIEEDLGTDVPAEVQQHMELLRGRVQRMEKLIDGILAFSRVGRVQGSIESVDTGQLLAETVDLLAPSEPASVEVADDMPTLKTDRILLQQVFANLIGNALKHAGRLDAHIRVGARDTGQMIEFAVADNGPGIAPQYHERIFGIFQTLASRDKVEGSGLGLALVKKIVELQQGRIWLESDEGRGATFFFTWPKTFTHEGAAHHGNEIAQHPAR